MKKTTTLTLGSLSALAGINHSDAAIVYFDVNPDQTINVGQNVFFGDINLNSGTYTLGSVTGDNMRFYLQSNLWARRGSLMQSPGYIGDFYAYKIPYGNPINNTVYSDTTSPSKWGPRVESWNYSSNPDPRYWNGSGSGYIGLRIDQGGGNFNYGWAHLNYISAGAASTLTISGFAFEGNLNTSINAGDQGGPSAVPEPGQVASSILLLAGIAGYFAYRRRVGAASEPDALHKLALGARGIADFRADKAA